MWESVKTSLREYATAWGHSAWWLVVGVILVLVDIYLKATDKPGIPQRVWVVLAIIVCLSLPSSYSITPGWSVKASSVKSTSCVTRNPRWAFNQLMLLGSRACGRCLGSCSERVVGSR